MILAASALSFDYIIYIAAAVWGVITWVKERKAKQEAQRTDEPTTRMPAPAPRPVEQSESEQERLRRFLEALGVPAGQQPQPPAPQPPRPVPVPAPIQSRPLPRRVIQQRPAPVVQSPAPKKMRVFEPEPEEIKLAGRLEEPASAVEGVGTTFDNMAKGIAMEPVAELERRAEVMGRTEVSGAGAIHMGAVTSKSIHATLRSPESIRTAFVLREVLGPPRSELL